MMGLLPAMMRTDLDHLPLRQQRELQRVVEMLHGEFADATALATTGWKKNGRIEKIVLFGSYARGGWVDEHRVGGGYKSDFDILIIVNTKKLADKVEFWAPIEDRLIRETISGKIKREVNIIVHSLQEVNNALSEGQYFFSDIVEQGILLYNLKGAKPFATPKPLTPEKALEVAERYYEYKMAKANSALAAYTATFNIQEWNEAAFNLHQAVERLYDCYLLVRTNYSPLSHNIKHLRSLCEGHEDRLIEAWPRAPKRNRSKFELLKRAYVEARYSEHYKITPEELEWLAERVEVLTSLVKMACEEHIAGLREAVRK